MGQPSRSFEEANPFFEQRKHQMHNPSISSLYNIYFMLYCALTYRSLMETSCIMNPLT
jgi:hypothetical protein